ncbi:hypothetical protein OF001_U10009 [Pseudomonas sp. OF001]|nr:hypothetical protein OF001_U10009 [Pseudomonas sp. OF001]
MPPCLVSLLGPPSHHGVLVSAARLFAQDCQAGCEADVRQEYSKSSAGWKKTIAPALINDCETLLAPHPLRLPQQHGRRDMTGAAAPLFHTRTRCTHEQEQHECHAR